MSRGRRRQLVAAWIVIAVVAALAHGPGLAGGFTNWDDSIFLLDNPLTEDPLAEGAGELLTTSRLAYPIPVTVLGYAAQRAVFGLEPGGFHTVSLLLHLAVCWLLFFLTRRLGASALAAAAAACLFAAHPLVVEPVAWVVGQKDLLAALLLLGAAGLRAHPRGDSPLRSVATVALAGLAIGAKPSAVAAPVILLLLDVVLERSPRRPSVWAVHLVIAAVAIASIAASLGGHAAADAGAELGSATLAGAGWAFALQLSHVAVPVELSPRYAPPAGIGYGVMVAVGWILAAGVIAAAWLALRRGARRVAWSIAGFGLAYLPSSGLIALSRGPADSYLYLPLALLAVAAALGLQRAARGPRRRSALVWIATAAAVLALSALARPQSRVWRGPVPLWRHAVHIEPDHPIPRHRLANAHMARGDVAGARDLLEDVVRRWPEHVAARVDLGLAMELEAQRLARRAAQTGQPAWSRAAAAELRAAENQLATAAELDPAPRTDEIYGFFLAGHPELEPSAPDSAARALRQIAPLLAERGARIATVERAAELLEGYGEAELAGRLRKRAQVLRQRQEP